MTQHPEKFIHSEQPGMRCCKETTVLVKCHKGGYSFFFFQIILQNCSIHVTVRTSSVRLQLCQSFPENRTVHVACVLTFWNSLWQLVWTSIVCAVMLRAGLVDKELAGELSGHTVLWSGGKQTDKPVCTQMLLRRVANQSADNNTECSFCFVAKLGNFIYRTKGTEWKQHANFNSGHELLQVCSCI